MPRILSIEEFLNKLKQEKLLLLDARSPAEFEHGHIPDAVNLPLLNNDERKEIGITYKHSGRKAAVIKGFELVGHKFGNYIKQVQEIYTGDDVLLYCWRGGMRSNIMAWLLQMAGYNVFLLKGGYKQYRNWVLFLLEKKYFFVVLGGKTGSGKTKLLQHLSDAGEQIIDLEKFACHRGSAFGSLGMPAQPTNEHFENELTFGLSKLNINNRIWVENESRKIGSIKIPDNIFNQIRNSAVIEIKISFQKRLQRILEEYAVFPVELLKEKSEKIKKRLGPNKLKDAIDFLSNNDLSSWAEIMLNYYDESYDYSNTSRHPETIIALETENLPEDELIKKLINSANNMYKQEEEAI